MNNINMNNTNNNTNNINMNNMNINNMYMDNMNMDNINMNNMNMKNKNNIYMNDTNYNNKNNLNQINNNNNMFNNNNMNMNNNFNNSNYITVFFSFNKIISINVNIKEKISNLIEQYKKEANIIDQNLVFYFNEKVLNPNLTIEEAGIKHKSTIFVKKENIKDNNREDECIYFDDDSDNTNNNPGYGSPQLFPPYGKNPSQLEKIINIKFIKQPGNKNYYMPYLNSELYGLLKLCLLKEISSKLNDYQINYLPDIISYIMKILKNGYIDSPNIKKTIKEVLEKMRGSNIINFSKYANEIITLNELNNIIALLKNDELNEINDIRNRLSIYNDYIVKFETEF
jgi:hypothetical protein